MQIDTLYNKIMDKPLIVKGQVSLVDDADVFTLDHVNYPKPKEYMTANDIPTAYLQITDHRQDPDQIITMPAAQVNYRGNTPDDYIVNVFEFGGSDLILVGNITANEWTFFGLDE